VDRGFLFVPSASEYLTMTSSLNHGLRRAALVAALAVPAVAFADVPPVDGVGRPARVICNIVGGQVVPAVHADKIIFRLTGPIQAAQAADQAALDAVKRNTELDIKVLDDPATVADLKGKVLTFLGGVDNVASRQFVKIIDVDYAMVCPAVPQPD
jgi:hypothetical protein